jgi:hypothetical protein
MTLTSTRELTRSKQHLDLSVLGSELDGVVKEVQENLLQAIRIAGDPPGKGIHHDLQTNAFSPPPVERSVSIDSFRAAGRPIRCRSRRILPEVRPSVARCKRASNA